MWKNQSKRNSINKFSFKDLSFETRFLLDPSVKLKTIFYLKKWEKIIVIGGIVKKAYFFSRSNQIWPH